MSTDFLAAAIAARHDDLIALRRDFHQHPELAFEEQRTAQIATDRLRASGLEVRAGLGKTGVVGILRGAAPAAGARTVLLRADMDALPIEEQSDAPYRSQTPGVMHACGHDGHVAILLTVASVLAEHRDQVPGTLIFVFQPAEERAGGAVAMIQDGALDPRPDYTLGLHLWTPFPAGSVGVKPGPIFASADGFTMRVRGVGGHGALPHTSVDPVVAAAQIVTALQTLVSREIAPSHQAVVTVGAIRGGTAFNVIADEVELLGTVRTYDAADREHLMRRIPELAQSIAAGMRAQIDFQADIGIPPCINDPAVAQVVRRASVATVGADRVIGDCMQMVGDDMAYFLDAAPGCYFLPGAGNPERGIEAPHHSTHFDIDEACLPIGVEILARSAFDLLEHGAD
jgi:amidohydrolase